jgi:hypothetical protein
MFLKILKIILFALIFICLLLVAVLWWGWWYEESQIYVHDYKPTIWQFWKRIPSSEISLNISNAEGALLIMDGKTFGNLDKYGGIIMKVTEGRHRFEVIKDGYKPFILEKEFKGTYYEGGKLVPLIPSVAPAKSPTKKQ